MPSIRDVMTSNPETIEPGKPVTEAAKVMKKADVGMVPVVIEGELFGTITDRDIVVRGIAEGKDIELTNVGELASRDVVVVEPDGDLEEALRLMAEHQVRRLPVVDGGRLVGVIAQADVARTAGGQVVGEVVESISR